MHWCSFIAVVGVPARVRARYLTVQDCLGNRGVWGPGRLGTRGVLHSQVAWSGDPGVVHSQVPWSGYTRGVWGPGCLAQAGTLVRVYSWSLGTGVSCTVRYLGQGILVESGDRGVLHSQVPWSGYIRGVWGPGCLGQSGTLVRVYSWSLGTGVSWTVRYLGQGTLVESGDRGVLDSQVPWSGYTRGVWGPGCLGQSGTLVRVYSWSLGTGVSWTVRYLGQ